MRVWDIPAGYLNRQSLLAEHRELHGLRSVIANGKKGYSRHPETLRWVGCLSGLARRHAALVAEMRLRGYNHLTPVAEAPRLIWPEIYVTEPADQYALLGTKYLNKPPGRIPLPRNAKGLWAAHKYSVLARDPEEYRAIGRRVARMRRGAGLAELAAELARILRDEPKPARLANALAHMWGHVARAATPEERHAAAGGGAALLATTQKVAARTREPHLTGSTALSELAVFTASLPA